jgi:hypothetical protein
VILAILGLIALWAVSTSNGGSILSLASGATPTPVPTPTPVRTPTPQAAIAIAIPGPEGTPTTIPIVIPTLPTLQIPTIVIPTNVTIPIPGAPGSNPTPPPNAKLTPDQARQKVKDTLSNCQLLQVQVDLALVTFEAPDWLVKLPLSGATWRVNDGTGAVTPDQQAADRARLCRL